MCFFGLCSSLFVLIFFYLPLKYSFSSSHGVHIKCKLIYLAVLCTRTRVHLVAGVVHSIVIKKDKMYLTVGPKRLTTLNMS